MTGTAFDYDVLNALEDANMASFALIQQDNTLSVAIAIVLVVALIGAAFAVAGYLEARRAREMAETIYGLLSTGSAAGRTPETFSQGADWLRSLRAPPAVDKPVVP